MKKIICAAIAVIALTIAATAHAATEIKFSFLAPEGSTWYKIIAQWGKDLEEKTQGRLKLALYAGGVSGDEKDVIRKMRINQIHAGAFTGLGLGLINPAVRVLELPMLAADYKEVDAVSKKLEPKLETGFEEKGFVLLGWTETGFVNIFSNKSISSRKDMKGMKMWAWEGDPLVEAMYKSFGLVPIPLPITDVMTSLQTKLIEAVYAPPLGAIALQWFTHTKYMTDMKLAHSTGGILITKQALAGISDADKQILKATGRQYAKLLNDATRADNQKSYATLKSSGITFVNVAPEEIAAIRETSKTVWNSLVGKLYSKELLDEAIAAAAQK